MRKWIWAIRNERHAQGSMKRKRKKRVGHMKVQGKKERKIAHIQEKEIKEKDGP
jgi:hypothetical protein